MKIGSEHAPPSSSNSAAIASDTGCGLVTAGIATLIATVANGLCLLLFAGAISAKSGAAQAQDVMAIFAVAPLAVIAFVASVISKQVVPSEDSKYLLRLRRIININLTLSIAQALLCIVAIGH